MLLDTAGTYAMKDRLITVLLSVASTYGVMHAVPERAKVLEVDRLIVRKELIVSDTGHPWEKGFEAQQIPRGVYARSLGDGPGGLWVRSRLIKGEIDDPFDDRFHGAGEGWQLAACARAHFVECLARRGLEANGDHSGEGLEFSEVPLKEWSGSTHPGRIRFQTFRPKAW